MATMNSGLGGPAGYGEGVFSSTTKTAGGNDDGSIQVDITSVFGTDGINFYGTTYTSIYVNSNGNISFGTPNTDYETADLSTESIPTIAPFWSDVNINAGGEIYWDLDPISGTVTVTWDGVAPYSGSGANSFQLVLTSTGGGDFEVEFIYEDIQWATGFNQEAETGFTDGGANDFELPGSGNSTALLAYETTDFGTGDPNGAIGITFFNGQPFTAAGTVEGTTGADVMDASYLGDPEGDTIGAGDDNIFADAGDDIITGGGGADIIVAGDGNDTVIWNAGDGSDTIYGGEGAETTGDTLDITATGNTTSTVLTGDGTGSTTIGADTLDFTDFEAFIFDAGTADTFDGSADSTGLTIDTGAGDDTITGGTGADTILGGDGNDTIYGDPVTGATNEDLNWSLQGGDATNLGTGFTQNTGTMDVSVTMTSTGNNNPSLTVETVETQYVAGGETFSANSSGRLFGQGDADTADLTIDFAAAAGSGMTNEVQDVAFRINDIDSVSGNHWDQFTITALDANGTPVAVTITPAGNDTVSGNTVTAAFNINETESSPDGSVLVEIAGPVSQITISYENLDTNTQAIFLTDIEFTTIPAPASGDGDTIDGGAGDDLIYGELGDDVITGGAGDDQIYGGDGNDTILASGEVNPNPEAWISEIDYRGNGEAAGEFIEITALGSADLSTLTLSFYTVPGGYSPGDSPTLSTGTTSSFFPSTAEITLQDILDATGGVLPTPGSPVSLATGIAGGLDLTVSVHPDNPDYLVFQVPANMVSPLTGSADPAEAIALTNTETGTVIQAYDIGTDNNFGALSGGAADGAVPVATGTTGPSTTLQIDSTLTITANVADTPGTSDLIEYAFDDGIDTIFGGAGDDIIELGAGDTATGGGGDDLFIIDPETAHGGLGSTITIIGDEHDEVNGGDTLDFSGLIDFGSITYTDPESGSVTMSDGTTIVFSNIENIIICFTHGTLIETPWGPRPIETLRPGDFVLTRDNGPQPLRWIGQSTVPAKGLLAPVRFARGAFGNDRELLVSPQHRMLYEGGDATLYFDSPEVMVPAKHLINGGSIRQVEQDEVTYIHILFDNHEVVWANGSPSESFHPGAEGLAAIDTPTREELFEVFPQLRGNPGGYGRTARTVLKGYEARLIGFA